MKTYADLERDALLDLAARTLADPDADPTHVESARVVLLRGPRALDRAAIEERLALLPPPVVHKLRALVRGLDGG